MRRRLIGAVAGLLTLVPLAAAAPAGGQYPVTTPDATRLLLPSGTPVDGDIPVVGDWNGDGAATVGVRRGATFLLRNENTAGHADVTLDCGIPGDRPVAGDWNGDGTTTIGVRRGAEFYLRNSNTTGQADITVTFGLATDFPVVGDWDGDGMTTIGVFRAAGGTWYLRNSNTPGPADITITFGDFFPGQPVVGDWDGNGTTTVGIYRSYQTPDSPSIFARNSNTSDPPDVHLVYGVPDDAAIAGDWNGDGVDTIGVRRDAQFYLTNARIPDISVNASAIATLAFTYGLATAVRRYG